jgi:hypothetical protein
VTEDELAKIIALVQDVGYREPLPPLIRREDRPICNFMKGYITGAMVQALQQMPHNDPFHVHGEVEGPRKAPDV